jgi:hypothetical protein
VDPGVGVEPVDHRDERVGGRVDGEPLDRPIHPGGLAGLLLVLDVDLAGRVVTDQHDGQAGDNPRLVLQARHLGGDLLADLSREGFSVEQPSGHGRTPSRGDILRRVYATEDVTTRTLIRDVEVIWRYSRRTGGDR